MQPNVDRDRTMNNFERRKSPGAELGLGVADVSNFWSDWLFTEEIITSEGRCLRRGRRREFVTLEYKLDEADL